MKNKFLILLSFFLLGCNFVFAQFKVQTGRLVEHRMFQSDYISPRDVCVWLPADYSSGKKYDVLYMHDGQMLFDASTTWNGQEWQVDEIVGRLIRENKIKPCIVVAVSNISSTRYGDYFPQKSLQYLPQGTPIADGVTFNADNYLRFLVEEVKPFVDRTYSTNKGVEHTCVMGSSMGGLISLYALCEYPDIFGGAGCLSTHVPMVLSNTLPNSQADVYAKAFRDYLAKHLPRANSRLIYMDRGDATLDAFYPTYQDALDSLMKAKGWQMPSWTSRVFPGAAHTETDWAARLATPLLFLMGNRKTESVEKVEPTFWWTGMKNPRLQLMIYGNNIASFTPSIDYPGVTVESVHPLESPNYLFVYLQVGQARPGKFNIRFTNGKKNLNYEYELKERTGRPEERKGFDSSDAIYLLMPDRFANGDETNDRLPMTYPYVTDRKQMGARHGGDLAGLIQHLDYLDTLGITAVWTTPVLENDMGEMSYHGYAATNYYQVDPRLGTNEDYVRLAEAMHGRDMKLIMDMVFNHCGSKHPWMIDPPMRSWFNTPDGDVFTNHNKTVFLDPYASDVEKTEMTDGWFVESMPDLNQRNSFLADYLIQNSIWWIEYAKLDGIRQDTYPYPDGDMMTRWCKEVMDEYPNMNIVGEVLVTNPLGTAYWQQGNRFNPKNTGLKSVMDFHLQAIASKAFHEETTWNTGLQTIFEHFAYDGCYADVYNVMRLYENHDVDRFLPEPPKDLNAYKQAVTVLLTVPGIPQIFYGQEMLFNGTTQKFGFEGIRPDMTGGWKEDEKSLFVAEGRTPMQQEAYTFMRTLLQWRKGSEVIARGSMKHFMPRNGIYVYERAWQGRQVLVVLNGVSRDNELSLNHYREVIGDKRTGVDVITGKTVELKDMLKLSPKEVLVLELK